MPIFVRIAALIGTAIGYLLTVREFKKLSANEKKKQKKQK